MAFTPITVTRHYKTPGGYAAQGVVYFTPSDVMHNGDTVIASTERGELDRDGVLSIVVYANNNPGTTPPGTYYTVHEDITGQNKRSYTVVIPYNAVGGTVNLATLAPVTTTPPALTYVSSVNGMSGAVTLTGDGSGFDGKQLSFTDTADDTRAQIVTVSGDLWILANAVWDSGTDEFYRIDTTKAAFGWQIQAVGLIPGEPELGYNVAGATMWVAQPAAYTVIRNGGSTSNPRFAGVGGWELGHTLTQERQFTVGGMGIELDGSGTYPYSRVVHSTTGTTYARRLSGGMHNTYPDLGGRDDVAKPGWFWGWNEQYNTGTGATVAGSRKWTVAYLPAGTTQFLQRFSIDESGTVSADNLHADSLLAVGYPTVGGGATVLGIQNATTVPTSDPTGGGVAYAEGGALKYRGSGGAITTIAPTTAVATKTSAYTFVATDVGVEHAYNSSSAGTFTVPTDASASIPIGATVPLAQLGTGQLTIAGASGVTVNARGGALKLAGQHAQAEIKKTGSNTWRLYGDITT